MIERMVSLVLAQVTPPSAADNPSASDALAVQSIWDFVVKGGPVMIPIGLCSLVMAAVALERLLVLRRSRIVPPGFVESILDALDREGVDGAIERCRAAASPAANVCAAGLSRVDMGIDAAERNASEAGIREMLIMRRRVRMLAVCASVAPLLGLLGTIFGMINAFQTVAMSADSLGRTELLARGIYEAMITTAAGLLVAIPALVLHHWVSARIEALMGELDRVVGVVLTRATEKRALRRTPMTVSIDAPEPIEALV